MLVKGAYDVYHVAAPIVVGSVISPALQLLHDDVIKWKHFPGYWPFVWEFTVHRWIPRTKASEAGWVSEWVSEWVNLTAFLGTAGSDVHIVHISRAIIAYTLESLSSLTSIPHNLHATINFKKKYIKNETQKSEDTFWVDLSLEPTTLLRFTMTLNLN